MATQSSILAWRIPKDRGAWQAAVHGVTQSQPPLSDQHFHFLFFPPEPPSLAPSHPSRSAQTARLGSLCYIATSHQLSILHQYNIAKQFSSNKRKKEKEIYLWKNSLNIDKYVRKVEM